MPIKKENRSRYPKNWKQISADLIHNRAGNRCERCGIHNHAVGYRDEEGNFHPEFGNYITDKLGRGIDYRTDKMIDYKSAQSYAEFATTNDERGHKYIVIVLTTAHLDHVPENCDPSNLWVLCQKCHNNYDQVHRTETIKKVKSNGQLNLFK